MTTAARPTAELAVRDDQLKFDETQIASLRRIFGRGVEGAGAADFSYLFAQMRRTGLSPFDRQIYLIMRKEWDPNVGQSVAKPTIQVGIDGFRSLAQDGAREQGVRISHCNPQWCGPTGRWKDVWLQSLPPVACKYRVEFGEGDFVEMTVMFAEYVPLTDEYEGTGNNRKKTGRKIPQGLWGKMPASQLAKCAEAVTLRKAFPIKLSGMYEPAELEQDGIIDVQPVQTPQGTVHRVPDEQVADRDWIDELKRATTGTQVSEIWAQARAARQLTTEMDALARQRGAEFQAAQAEPPDESGQ